MKRFLALDTSTWWGSVALVERASSGGAPIVVAGFSKRVEGSHVESLLAWVERLLGQAGWSKTGIDAYVATCGPGSFTGVRVGLGTVRGLGLAAGRPCLGVNTLEALAEGYGPAVRPRVALMDAGRDELYAACYDPASSPPGEIEPPHLGPAADVLEKASAVDALLIPGPGTVIPETWRAQAVATPECVAAAAGRIAVLRTADPEWEAPPLAPLYLRVPDAMLKRLRR